MIIRQVEFRPGKGVVVADAEIDQVGPNEVLIEPEFSYLSAGTELAALRSVRASAGDSPPVTSGYSQVGTVLAVGERVDHVDVGDRVVAVGGAAYHATRTLVGRNLVVRVPAGVDPAEAATMAMCCFALEAVSKSAVRIGQSVVVFGAGMMGQVAARLYQIAGARVAIMDGVATRLDLAPSDIARFALDDDGWAGLGDWAGRYGIEHACICFGGEATGTVERLKPIMATAPDGVPHGRIVFPGGARVSLLMASNLGNLELLSSAKAGPGYRDVDYEHGHDYPTVYVGSPVHRNVETLLQLMAAEKLRLSGLISHRFPLDRATDAYRIAEESPEQTMAVLLSYP